MSLSADRLREMLAYDPNTGIFTWRVARGSSVIGHRTGSPNADGHITIRLEKRTHYAHRLAWLYVHGEWPPSQIDHINRDPSDNRLANLRLANGSQNSQNRRHPQRSSSGLRGVYRDGNRWRAMIKKKGIIRYLGTFDQVDEAGAAYDKAARELFGEFAITNAALKEPS